MIIESIYFMIPAFIANMMPVVMRNKFKFLAKPIDRGIECCGKPILGNNKTWRGLIFGVIGSVIASYTMFLLQNYNYFNQISIINYSNWFLIGILMGSGALIGDMIKSFFKRRIGIKSGQPWYLVDQIDFPLGAILFVSIVYFPGLKFSFLAIVITITLTIVTNHLAYWLGIRKVKW